MSPISQEAKAMLLDETRNDDAQWTTRITPRRGYFDWRLAQLIEYRDLIMMFVWRDFVSVYKQTVLGPAWHIIQPLLTTLMFTVIFSKVARLPTDGAPPFLFYLAGTVLWSFFSGNLLKIASTFLANSHLLGKVYFHRMVIPISTTISSFITFGIQFGIFLTFVVWHSVHTGQFRVTPWTFATPVLVLVLAGYSLGGGIIVAALTTRYRDLGNLVGFGVQLVMYATPIIYPASSVPAGFRWLIQLNPLTPILEAFRVGFLGAGTVDLHQLAISFGLMVIVVCGGMMLFSRAERTFMDTV